MKIEDKEKIEIDFWKDSAEENPEVFSIPNLINKFKDAEVFLEKISQYSAVFRSSAKTLEVGAGQGWASCMVKSYHKNSQITTTDISPYAIQSLKLWEGVFNVSIDHRLDCKSYSIPLEDETFDLIFCFASAHHFVKHTASIKEFRRLLKPGGRILYLHEPICRTYIYKFAKNRVNRKRPEVPEDILLYKRIKEIAKEEGFDIDVKFAPTTKNRSLIGMIYFSLLSKLPILQRFLPCTADFLMIKK